MKITAGFRRSLVAFAVVTALLGYAQPQADAAVRANVSTTQSAAQTTASSATLSRTPPALPPGGVFVSQACRSRQCSLASGLISELPGGTIRDGVSNPVAMAVDGSGNLYVSNALLNGNGNITVYSRKGQLFRVLTGFRGGAYAIKFDRAGDLYVVSNRIFGCCEIQGYVTIFAPGATRPSRWLADTAAFPGKPAFDADGTYYQPNFYVFPGWISVYAPGASSPSKFIRDGIGFPMAVTVDVYGQVYVLNNIFGGGTDVLLYPRNSASLITTIQTGVVNASAIAVDSNDELYVANRGSGNIPASVTIYAPWMTTPWRTIHEGINEPVALALDASGNLYVGNAPAAGPNTVSVYAPNTTTPEATYSLKYAPTAIIAP